MYLVVTFLGELWFFCLEDCVCVFVCVRVKKRELLVQALVLCQFGSVIFFFFGVCLAAAARVSWPWFSPCW